MDNKEFEKKLASVNLIYDIVRGSHLHGTATETSDIDRMGVFVAPMDEIYGLRDNYMPQFSDEKNDRVYYEVGRFLELLIKSNPTMLEALFAEGECVVYNDNDIMRKILTMRDKFLSKDALLSFSNYAYEQIRKAHGYKKLCAYPEDMERKQPIDFCYTFNDKQGTEPIIDWLNSRGLKQIYCGLNHMQNMDLMHGIFYDWGQHLHMEFSSFDEFVNYEVEHSNYFTQQILKMYEGYLNKIATEEHKYLSGNGSYYQYGEDFYQYLKPKGYHGIVKEDGSSCDIHLDSIIKGDKPINYLSYNLNGYASHCKMYKEWSDWKKKRNEIRYKSNFGQGYDAKNVSECIRLLRMAVELAETGEFNLDRKKKGDAQYLLDIKAHKYTYEELMEEADILKSKLDELIKTCSLPDHVDKDMVNDLLISIRKSYK